MDLTVIRRLRICVLQSKFERLSPPVANIARNGGTSSILVTSSLVIGVILRIKKSGHPKYHTSTNACAAVRSCCHSHELTAIVTQLAVCRYITKYLFLSLIYLELSISGSNESWPLFGEKRVTPFIHGLVTHAPLYRGLIFLIDRPGYSW